MTVSQRRLARTLLPGSCREAEVAWFRATMECKLLDQGKPDQVARAGAQAYAPSLGYETYMLVAKVALNVLLLMSAPQGILPALQVYYGMFIHSALELISQQREPIFCSVDNVTRWAIYCTSERVLAKQTLDEILGAGLAKLDREAATLISNGMYCVHCSGVVAMRNLLAPYDPDESVGASLVAAAAEAAARGLRTCSLASCGSKEAHVSHFKRCAACQQAFYCCREHQLADWPAHKAACEAARKAAGAAPSSK
jgi:hypothetical protein